MMPSRDWTHRNSEVILKVIEKGLSMMQIRPTLRLIATILIFAATATTVPTRAFSQGGVQIAPASASGQGATPTWTTEQLITSTVHDAWLLSGKDEATFFEMVKTLAELSAKNRGVELPDTKAAGERMGNYIKRSAKADTDQLLYVVVDKAVMLASHQGPTPAGSKTTKAN
jgi:hypothetical protein